MKEFLKDNSALVAAIVLPLVLVCIFAASTLFINVTVEDPKNSFFVATNYNYAQSSSFTFDVVEEKLVVTYRAEQKDANGYYTNNNVPRLWRVNIPEQTVEEIALPVPANKKTTTLTIPGVTDIAVKNIHLPL